MDYSLLDQTLMKQITDVVDMASMYTSTLVLGNTIPVYDDEGQSTAP